MIENDIKKILKTYLEELLNKMVIDFPVNYNKKKHNWILNNLKESNVKNMVFVSSFESKYGNMFEDIATDIAKLTYGQQNVPNFIKGNDISETEFNDFVEKFTKKNKNKNMSTKQYVVSGFNKKASSGTITQFMNDNKGSGMGANKILPTLNQTNLEKFLDNDFVYNAKIKENPVDLIIKDFNGNYNLMEIKAGGNLDSSNSPGNIEKMLGFYAALGIYNTKLYFSTLYNYKGEGNKWTGTITAYLAEDMRLISQDFWNFVLPESVPFEDFKQIYFETNNEIGFTDKIDTLINE
jgi:hypothetical protein